VHALPTLNVAALFVAIASVAIILMLRRFRPHWPGLLIAVAFASLAAWICGLPVETIRTRFGGIPRSLRAPQIPAFSIEKVSPVLPSALSFALLGGIESLLSAVVADSMSGRRHRSNCELAAQGVANLASALFGGICVTGTIARTATNVRAGARGPIAGMLHSLFLLLFMLVAAPLASFIPLAALASVLAVVAWNMVEKHAFLTLIRAPRADTVVLLATFLLVVFRDLTEGILVGFGIGALLFLHRMGRPSTWRPGGRWWKKIVPTVRQAGRPMIQPSHRIATSSSYESPARSSLVQRRASRLRSTVGQSIRKSTFSILPPCRCSTAPLRSR
jgi:SulP family sulfate permease